MKKLIKSILMLLPALAFSTCVAVSEEEVISDGLPNNQPSSSTSFCKEQELNTEESSDLTLNQPSSSTSFCKGQELNTKEVEFPNTTDNIFTEEEMSFIQNLKSAVVDAHSLDAHSLLDLLDYKKPIFNCEIKNLLDFATGLLEKNNNILMLLKLSEKVMNTAEQTTDLKSIASEAIKTFNSTRCALEELNKSNQINAQCTDVIFNPENESEYNQDLMSYFAFTLVDLKSLAKSFEEKAAELRKQALKNAKLDNEEQALSKIKITASKMQALKTVFDFINPTQRINTAMEIILKNNDVKEEIEAFKKTVAPELYDQTQKITSLQMVLNNYIKYFAGCTFTIEENRAPQADNPEIKVEESTPVVGEIATPVKEEVFTPVEEKIPVVEETVPVEENLKTPTPSPTEEKIATPVEDIAPLTSTPVEEKIPVVEETVPVEETTTTL